MCDRYAVISCVVKMSYEKLRKIAIYGAVASISGAFVLHHYTQGLYLFYLFIGEINPVKLFSIQGASSTAVD